MRRGLMAWDTDELPAVALAQRLTRLRQAMQGHGLDGLIIYTNFPRPSAVAWLTAFTPYWADALLYVPREGEALFATALSKRVAKWIDTVKPVGELQCTMRPGKLVADRIAADASANTIGVLEFDALPNGLYDDLEQGAPSARFVEGGAAFAQARRAIDDAERGLIVHADGIAAQALDQVTTDMRDVGSVVGAVEKAARLAGAEEAYVHIAPDLHDHANLVRLSGPMPLGRRFAVRASVAYKGVWVRRLRTFSPDDADRAADAWLGETLSTLDGDRKLGAQLARPDLTSYVAEACIGSYPLEAIAGTQADTAIPDGALAVVTVKLALPTGTWLGGAPAIIGGSTAQDAAAA